MGRVSVEIAGSIDDPIDQIVIKLNAKISSIIKQPCNFTEERIVGIDRYDESMITVWVD